MEACGSVAEVAREQKSALHRELQNTHGDKAELAEAGGSVAEVGRKQINTIRLFVQGF